MGGVRDKRRSRYREGILGEGVGERGIEDRRRRDVKHWGVVADG